MITVLHADARYLPLPADSVDLIVTSPPYFGLRSYQDGGVHYDGQVGAEATPAEFVDALIDVTRECMRVLKPCGSMWVNLGDKYASSGGHGAGATSQRADRSQYVEQIGRTERNTSGVATKSLIGIPWRYALRCIDDLGLILRAEVIWSKPNGLPESVTDRVRRSHEQWFYFQQDTSGGVESLPEGLPLCDLCGRPVDARSTLVARLKEVQRGSESVGVPDHVGQDGRSDRTDTSSRHYDVAVGPLVSSVPTVGVSDPELVEQSVELDEDGLVAAVDHDPQDGSPVLGMSDKADGPLAVDESSEPSSVCECERHALTLNDEPWIPQSVAAELMQMVADGEADAQNVADYLSGDYARTHSTWFHFTLNPRYFSAVDEIREAHLEPHRIGRTDGTGKRADAAAGTFNVGNKAQGLYNLLGKLPGSVWTVPTEPLRVPEHLGVDHFAAFPTEFPRRIISGWSPADGIIVDPFGGTGTTAHVASALGRHGISVDLSSDYCRLANAPELADTRLRKVLGLDKAPAEVNGQADLFGGAA